MDQSSVRDIEFMIRHRHTDGPYGEMRSEPSHRAAADHDPERSWGLRRIFRCTTCDEAVTLVPGAEGEADEHR